MRLRRYFAPGQVRSGQGVVPRENTVCGGTDAEVLALRRYFQAAAGVREGGHPDL